MTSNDKLRAIAIVVVMVAATVVAVVGMVTGAS